MLRGPVFVGTDLSAAAGEALRQSAGLAADLGGRLIVCHVLPELLRVNMLFPQWRGIDSAREQSIRSKAEEAVRRHAEEILGAPGRDVAIVLEAGTPHVGLLAAADAARAGVIITGPGRVAGEVARHASVAVLVARPSPSHGPVIGATDFSDPSLPALNAAAAEARRRRSPLHLIHAVDVGMHMTGGARAGALPYLEGASAIALEGLDELRAAADRRLRESLQQYAVEGQAAVVSGRAAEGIVAWAETAGAQLVVVGTHGRSGMARLALGSTASAVIDRAPCSVLVVRLALS